ncbi:GNAT family N-acetyltransferase [Brachybacterium sp. GU-2]|uniref:GNAT family N-acetyltransferase n=1 Tax=Brachybacterium sp. GU-2 TaxID=3069708 RepID=UPI00280B5D76|nr:GNAT family N-acetyltransferase [Brachybacterium sp. GU-2]WME21635.1 GNAT family N-acetyltransferase [Brachybacterium sp. GU-2]
MGLLRVPEQSEAIEEVAHGHIEVVRDCLHLAGLPPRLTMARSSGWLPSATLTNRNVGYLAVLPQHRGHGYVDEILEYITRFHVGDGARRITATTDAVNTPMAAAFDRAGYKLVEVLIELELSPMH